MGSLTAIMNVAVSVYFPVELAACLILVPIYPESTAPSKRKSTKMSANITPTNAIKCALSFFIKKPPSDFIKNIGSLKIYYTSDKYGGAAAGENSVDTVPAATCRKQ